MQRNISIQAQIPSCVGGLNFNESYANMPPGDAIVLENFFPTAGGCKVREGFTIYNTPANFTADSTLMVWNGGDSDTPALRNQKLLLATSGRIYDVSVKGTATQIASGYTSNKWQSTSFGNSAGTFLYAVNGADNPFYYQNGTLTPITTGAGANQITGSGFSSVANLINVTSHKQRLWFVEKNTTKAWYLPLNSIYGTVTLFDFGFVFKKGGHLKAIETWTLDSGTGFDDYLLAISSKGEVAVYKGTDPSSAATWGLVGVYTIGSPIGYKCTTKYDGDVAIITKTGLVPFSAASKTSQSMANYNAYTQKIQLLISDLVEVNQLNYGWQVLVLPKYNMLILNVPKNDGTSRFLVMNTVTQAWCDFTGISTTTIVEYYDDLYFTMGGHVYMGFNGYADGTAIDGTGGLTIVARAQQAYSFLDNPGLVKHARLMRPLVLASTDNIVAVKVLADYDLIDDTFTAVPSVYTGGGTPWDTKLWDTFSWGSSDTIIKRFLGVDALGFALSVCLVVRSQSGATWVATSLIYEDGGLLG